MSWMGPGRRYYYQRKRVGGRREYTYYGAGATAHLIAEIDGLDRERREQEQVEARLARSEFAELAAASPDLVALLAEARLEVERVLTEAGYHQHKRQWRKKRGKKEAD